jgi:outer membrane protein assembly factor BamB
MPFSCRVGLKTAVMTKYLLLLLLGFPFALAGQVELSYTIKIKDLSQNPMAGVVVTLEETSTKEQLKKTTDADGNAFFVITFGAEFQIKYKDEVNKRTIKVPPRGVGEGSRTCTYVPAEKRVSDEPLADRSNVQFRLFKQTNSADRYPPSGKARIDIKVRNRDKQMLPNMTVHLTNVGLKLRYHNTTDNSGEAQFVVPPGIDFEVDVESANGLKRITSPAIGHVGGVTATYVKSAMQELNRGDTIVQQFASDPKPSSTHALMVVNLVDFSGNPLGTENVWYDQLGGTAVYESTTSDVGKATFLLPKGFDYTLHFTYEREVSMFFNKDMSGFYGGEGNYAYRGTEHIEDFYASAKKDKNGFTIEFMKTPIEPSDLTYNYLETTAKGFNFNFDSKTPITTPTLAGNDMYMSGGSYSPEFYSFNSSTGALNWAVTLSENGASSAVVSESIVLVITESCTLYAINRKTGELIWSMWLGPYLYSTPTVHQGKVLATYPTELGNSRNVDRAFALLSIDLETGKIDWQQWTDAEVMGAPVGAADKIYMTSLAGTLYQFNAADGKLVRRSAINATSPPTIVGDDLYIAQQRTHDGSDGEIMAKYSAKSGELVSRFVNLTTTGEVLARNQELRFDGMMNYNGMRATHCNGLNYSVLDNTLYCYAENGRIHWEKTLPRPHEETGGPIACAPVIAMGKVVVTTKAGEICLFDAVEGTALKSLEVGKPMWTQPALNNGVVYAGTTDGALVCIKTGDRSYTGWTTWGYDASHNPVVR